MRKTIKTIKMEFCYESSDSSEEEVVVRCVRGRGRGRRGGGRGRGYSLGGATVSNINSRQDNINTTVDHMSDKTCKGILKKVAAREPSMLLDFIQTSNHSIPSKKSTPKEVKGWCVCGNCRQMPKEEVLCFCLDNVKVICCKFVVCGKGLKQD